MAKHVFNSDMVFHAFNSQTVDHGRRSDGRVYFEGATLYSYGRHYALAHIMPDGAVLLNSYKRSVSTGQHMSGARAGTRNRAQYFMPHVEDLISNFDFRDIGKPGRVRLERWLSDRYASAMRKGLEAIPDATADYLLSYTGTKPGYWLKLKARLDRKHADYLARTARETLAAAIAKGKRYAAHSDAEIMRECYRIEGVEKQEYRKEPGRWSKEWVTLPPSEVLRVGALREFESLLKSAREYGRNKTLIARLTHIGRMVRARVKTLQKGEHLSRELQLFMRRKTAFRADLAAFNAGSLDRVGHANLAGAASYFMGFRGIAPDGLRKLEAACHEFERAAVEREAAERMERERAAREAWLQGEGGRYGARFSDINGRALLRVRGEELETSHGASVPLAHAVKAFPLIKLCRETGREWKRNGHTVRVGHFQIDAIDAQGNFKAGCHDIGWNEVERIARQLGVFETAPADTSESTH